MKTMICLYKFLIILPYVLLSDVITAETTMGNEIPDLEEGKNCNCNKLKCSCCEYLDWKFINVNGLVCADIKYVADNVGVILSVTYNNTVIIQQKIFLEEQIPICIKDNIVGILPGSLCIYAYDIVATPQNFHACFKIVGSVFNIKFTTINLGCFNIKKNGINKMNLNEML
ncbi:uncharacterized protein LOC143260406 [Megalopta genalis]|uniref:uncharacterized protein LOC143260406 n=1 Tax=Megalopta genalis TaxID=115081 RepID=UPI003FCFEC96